MVVVRLQCDDDGCCQERRMSKRMLRCVASISYN